VDVERAVALAEGLLAEHGLAGWTVVLDRARTRAGACRADRREIGLSAPLTALHPEAEVRDTVLHEIAHALVGPHHGHDAVWRAAARRIGGSGERTSSAPRPEGPWRGTCPAGHTTTRHRRPVRVVACGRCGRSFDPANVLRWTLRGAEVPLEAMTPAYRREWAGLRSAPAPASAPEAAPAPDLPVGTVVRVGGTGRFAGATGRVVRRGRTRYRVEVAGGVLTVPFALALPAP
jgi:predicted SprT family Zn-dependent metalloprotease